MMSCLHDKSSSAALPGKYLIERGRCEAHNVMRKSKCQKVDAVEQCPRNCDALADQVIETCTKSLANVKAATENLKVGSPVNILPVKSRLKLGQIKLDDGDATELREATAKPRLSGRKFYEGSGRVVNAFGSKSVVSPKLRSGVNQQHLVETIHIDSVKTTGKYHENGSAFAREVEEGEILDEGFATDLEDGEILDDIHNKMKAKTGKDVAVENGKLFDLQKNLKYPVDCADADTTQVGKMGSFSDLCSRYKLGLKKYDSIDLSPTGGAIGMLQSKRISKFTLANVAIGCDDKKHELNGFNQSNCLCWKQDQPNSQHLDRVLDDSEEHVDTSIVLFNTQADPIRTQVKETLNLFKQILEEQLLNAKKVSVYTYVEAAMKLKEQGKWVNASEHVLGSVPGVEVGDKFHFRAELVVIGLHRPFAAGIDFMDIDGKKIATSIVASGRYMNETEFNDVLIYSGEGQNPAIKDKKLEDQTLVRGNLALKNSMDEGTPVRVIRGFRAWKSYRSGDRKREKEATFTYDGLYVVTKYWQDKGKFGKLVYMFQLNKIQGQPNLTLKSSSCSGKSKILSKSRLSKALCKSGRTKLLTVSAKAKVLHDNIILDDIAYGKEKIPIRVVNDIDDEKPPHFNYIANVVYPQVNGSHMTKCCDCIDGCSDDVKCYCVSKNRGEVPYNENGAIIRRRPIVYECGPFCKCPPSCKNRVSQHGVKLQLEVFKTKSRGWGLRSRNFISSGSFICEYVGEFLDDKQADERIDCDEYLFDLGSGNCFAIDAAKYGNVGRFLNHSCSPNLYAQDVLFDHDNKNMAHLMLFATEDIPPLQELTFHYNYKIGQVRDMNGNVKKKGCYCGAQDCTGRMY